MNINKFLCNYHMERYNNCNMKFLNFDYKDCTNTKDGYEMNKMNEMKQIYSRERTKIWQTTGSCRLLI